MCTVVVGLVCECIFVKPYDFVSEQREKSKAKAKAAATETGQPVPEAPMEMKPHVEITAPGSMPQVEAEDAPGIPLSPSSTLVDSEHGDGRGIEETLDDTAGGSSIRSGSLESCSSRNTLTAQSSNAASYTSQFPANSSL